MKGEKQGGMDPKALLDELMGKDRDLPLDQQKKKRLQFDDPQVLSAFLPSFSMCLCLLSIALSRFGFCKYVLLPDLRPNLKFL